MLNQDHLLTDVCSHAEDGKPMQLILVPEQISHMLERKLCEVGGDSISQYAEILGFSRLALRVFSEYGGIAESETDAAGKLLTMCLTVEQLRSRLKLYGGKALKPSFLLQLSRTLDELRSACISPQLLRKNLSSVQGAFAVKMEELALLLEGYDSICENLGQSAESRLSRLLMALEQNDFARDKTFRFYGFTDFNGIEIEIIRELLVQGAEVTVHLLCDSIDTGKPQFSTAAATGRELVRIAQHSQIPYEISQPVLQERREGISFLREHLFSSDSETSEEEERVHFITASDIASECRMIGGEVLTLMEQGVRLRDITVACANYSAYKAPLRTVFRRAEIPAYFAGDTDILKQPVVHMILAALDSAVEPEQESVLDYLKTGFSGLSYREADLLENYVLMWDISGKGFEEPWTMGTQGLKKENEDVKKSRLEKLNQSRRTLMDPILHLRKGLKTAKNTGEMLLSLNSFMEEISLNQQLNAEALWFSENHEKQKAQEYAQVYGILCKLMEQMYGVLGETVRSVEDFVMLFKTAVSLYTVGTIPATIDCVNIGSLSSQRNCDTPYLFVVGANEGSFPAVQGNQSLLSDQERQKLIDLEISISPNTLATGRLNRELAMMDSVFGGPVKTAYISALGGKESHFYLRGRKLFPKGKVIDNDQALVLRSARDHEARFDVKQEYSVPDLSADAVRALYGEKLRLSASKLEKMASCRFAFFLRYGLNAEENRVAEIDASIFGTFVHDVLENTAAQVMDEGGFHVVQLDRVMEIADHYMERYAQQELSDLWKSERAEYLFRRNFNEVRIVVKRLYDELSVSQFAPDRFELEFADRENASVSGIPVMGKTVNGSLEGKIDRMDIWEHDSQTYYRIVDYKTGHTKFDYSEVYYGLGLQMLIYLFALKEFEGKLEYKNMIPSGVLYFPAQCKKVPISSGDDDGELNKYRNNERRASGLILNDPVVVEAMEPGEVTRYLPCTRKDGELTNYVATAEEMELLRDHVTRRVSELADGIYSGKLEPDPYYLDSKRYGCGWCPYKTICGDQVERRVLDKLKAEAFWQRIREDYDGQD